MNNYNKEKLLEMFDAISNAADFSKYLIADSQNPLMMPKVEVSELLDIIHTRLERIMEITEEINEFVENFADC